MDTAQGFQTGKEMLEDTVDGVITYDFIKTRPHKVTVSYKR